MVCFHTFPRGYFYCYFFIPFNSNLIQVSNNVEMAEVMRQSAIVIQMNISNVAVASALINPIVVILVS